MKKCVYILSFLAFILIHQQCLVFGQNFDHNDLKWFEFNRTLYRIEVEAESQWKDAYAQCKKEKMELVKWTPELRSKELVLYMMLVYKSVPSLWADNNATDTKFMQKIGFKLSKNGKGHKCNMINSTSFELSQEECDKRLGFICQRTLKDKHSIHIQGLKVYYIEPQANFTCNEAKNICTQKNMTLTLAENYNNNTLLKDNTFYNYGSAATFWLDRNTTNGECVALNRANRVNLSPVHGFICEQTLVKALLSFRHLVLIISVALVAVVAIIVFIVCKCCLHRKKEEIVTITEPVKK